MSGNADEGFTIMTQFLPCFLIHGTSFDKGRAQVVYTKCKIARVKSQSTDLFTQGIAVVIKSIHTRYCCCDK